MLARRERELIEAGLGYMHGARAALARPRDLLASKENAARAIAKGWFENLQKACAAARMLGQRGVGSKMSPTDRSNLVADMATRLDMECATGMSISQKKCLTASAHKEYSGEHQQTDSDSPLIGRKVFCKKSLTKEKSEC